MKKIIDYIKEKYSPSVFILYGSYSSGTADADSDFDALIIADTEEVLHDTSIAFGVRLDLFVYPENYFGKDIDCEEIIQIYGGKILFDSRDIGKSLLLCVEDFINSYPKKSRKENAESVAWCKKMLIRTKREDCEGLYRHHWLLCDSLQIYFDIIGKYYQGPKKSLALLEKEDAEAYAIYNNALKDMSYASLLRWIDFLCEKFNRK